MSTSSSSKFSFTPTIIIGAGRSGTNILRDTLTQLPGFATWPCDEINPIWRHGNLLWPNDEIPPEKLTTKTRSFIRSAFERIWKEQGKPNFVVEKTCANSLRVPFIDAALPEAKYIYIVRDGFDVVASAQKRWKGKLEVPGLPYFMSKARYTPFRDLPIYCLSFLRSRISLVFGKTRRLAVWGPRFKGMNNLPNAPLEDLCALQWAACVNQSDASFAAIDKDRVIYIRYEDFVSQPQAQVDRILAFLGEDKSAERAQEAISRVRKTSVGKGRTSELNLSKDVLEHMSKPMKKHGY